MGGGCWVGGGWVLGGCWAALASRTRGGVPVGQPRQALATDNTPRQIKARARRGCGQDGSRSQVRAWPSAHFLLLWGVLMSVPCGGQGRVRRVWLGSALPPAYAAVSLALLGAPAPRTSGAQRGCGSTTLLLSPGASPQGLAQHFRLDPGLSLPAAPWWVLSDVQWVQPPALGSFS